MMISEEYPMYMGQISSPKRDRGSVQIREHGVKAIMPQHCERGFGSGNGYGGVHKEILFSAMNIKFI